MEERYDVIAEQAARTKTPEDLLPNGTVVYLNREAERTPRVILWSLPDDHYPHRYRVDGTFGVCVTRDFTVVRLPTPEEQAFYDQQNEERHRAFDGIARWLETSRESREGAGDNGAVSQETGDH